MGCCASKKKPPMSALRAPLPCPKDTQKFPENTDPTQEAEVGNLKKTQVITESSKAGKKTTQTNEKGVRSARVVVDPQVKAEPKESKLPSTNLTDQEEGKWKEKIRAEFVEATERTQENSNEDGGSRKGKKADEVVKKPPKEVPPKPSTSVQMDVTQTDPTTGLALPTRTGSMEPTPELPAPNRPSVETVGGSREPVA